MNQYEKRKDSILKDVSELIKIKSITKDRKKNREALEWIISRAAEMGLQGGFAIDSEVAIVTLGFGKWEGIEEFKELFFASGRETLGILAHVDVVPAEGAWATPPFEGTLKDGYLSGRGVVDDKGPLVLCIHAIAELAQTMDESQLKRNVLMVIGSREEDSWLDMEAFNRLGIKPDFGFTPDGEFPISNREKGYVDVAFRFRRNICDRGYILSGGSAANMIPANAQLLIKNADGTLKNQCDFKGVSTHSSKPENGVNAIIKMAEGMQTEKLSETARRLLWFVKESFPDCYGSGLNLDSGETVVEGEFFDRNVVSPVMLKTEENYYELIVNMRTTWGYNGIKIFEALERTAAEWDVEIDILECMNPTMISRDSDFIKTLKRVYQFEAGGEFDFELAYGTSYAKAMPNIVAFGPVFPGELDTCHESDERMEVERFMTAGRIYWKAIKEICI